MEIRDLASDVWHLEWQRAAQDSPPRPAAAPGYSQSWFGGGHRVLRGGSWATQAPALRASFRNWYQPEAHEMLAGFRCARD